MPVKDDVNGGYNNRLNDEAGCPFLISNGYFSINFKTGRHFGQPNINNY